MDTPIASVQRARATTGAAAGLFALVGLAVAVQIAYPLLHGRSRDAATVAIVVLLAASCVVHAAVTRGPAFAAAMAVATAVPGFVVEVVGVRTGWPFGHYGYGDGLGARLVGVPPVVALAWTMLAWPAAIAARTLVRSTAARIVVGAWALASTDLFLDPQMVRNGYWTWRHTSPHLPGVGAVPLTNYAGWLAVALVVSAALQGLLARRPARVDDRVAVGLYLWLYAGWVLALAVFGRLADAAGWGALGMGVVAVPLALRWRAWR